MPLSCVFRATLGRPVLPSCLQQGLLPSNMQWAVSPRHHCTLCHRTPRPRPATIRLHLSTWGKNTASKIFLWNNYWFLTVGTGCVSIFTALLSSQQRCEHSIHEPSSRSSLRSSGRSGRGHVDLSQLQHAPSILSHGCPPSPGSPGAAAAGGVLSAAAAVKLQLSSGPETDTNKMFPLPSSVWALLCGLGTLTQTFSPCLGHLNQTQFSSVCKPGFSRRRGGVIDHNWNN